MGDFSAIEARITAWLTEEQWRLDVFNGDGKIYEASAAQMFKVPIVSVTKELRQRGKISELALGFGGGVGALTKMDSQKQLREKDLPELIASWRNASPNIVQLWWDVQRAAITAVREKRKVPLHHGIAFSYEAGLLFIQLPSGRRLAYPRPKLELNKFGKDELSYEGIEQTTRQWNRIKTYGGRLVENIVQAIARDCLRDALFRLDEAGYQIVLHVHDEVVVEAPEGLSSLEHMLSIMEQPINWAHGLPMAVDGFEGSYYKKAD